MTARALAVWAVLVVAAIANGAFREGFLVSRLGAAAAHVISTGMLCIAIFLVAVATVKWIRPTSASDAWLVGTLWLALVLAFEFGFGHYVAHKPWSVLLADYNVARGRVWVAVPVLTWFAPWLAARIRHLL